MSMDMWLRFFRSPTDPGMRKKIEAAYACEAADVPIPQELRDYLAPVFEEFGGLPHGDRGQAIEAMLEIKVADDEIRKKFVWRGDSAEGFEVDLADLPTGTAKIRFDCSW